MRRYALNGPFVGIELTKPLLMVIILWVLVIIQAVAVIYIKQSKRITHAKIQQSYSTRDKLQVEWSQLLLEQSTWQSDARVEKIAREKLGMVVPDKVNVIVP